MSDKKDILLGVDFGTGGCKVTAVSTGGDVLAEASVEYPTEFPERGRAEQNPAQWYPAMCRAIAALASKGVALSEICAVAFDGSTHNAVLLDSAMRPVRNTIMWTDQRSVAECEILRREHLDEIFSTAFQMPTPTWTLPQMMWLKRNEPEVLARTSRILFVKDYVRYLATGVAATDYIEAQGTLFFDMRARRWSESLAKLAGFGASVLPEIVKPADVVGKILPNVADDTGIPAGTPVVCGTSDSAAEDYGAGAVDVGDCILKLATAGNVNVMTAEPHPYKTTLTYSHVVDGMWYTVSATNAAALCQRWFRDAFCQAERYVGDASGRRAFAVMDEIAARSPAGANGVMFHPYLQGERSPYWDANLRASFTGVGISSSKADFMRALLEGVAFSLKDCYGAIKDMELKVDRFFLIGGGARSRLWGSIIADVFNSEVLVPTPGDASYGAALIAGVGVGAFADARSAVKKCLKIGARLEPNPEKADFYAGLFRKYLAVHDALAPVYGGNF